MKTLQLVLVLGNHVRMPPELDGRTRLFSYRVTRLRNTAWTWTWQPPSEFPLRFPALALVPEVPTVDRHWRSCVVVVWANFRISFVVFGQRIFPAQLTFRSVQLSSVQFRATEDPAVGYVLFYPGVYACSFCWSCATRPSPSRPRPRPRPHLTPRNAPKIARSFRNAPTYPCASVHGHTYVRRRYLYIRTATPWTRIHAYRTSEIRADFFYMRTISPEEMGLCEVGNGHGSCRVISA